MPGTRIACPRCQSVLSSETALPAGRLLRCAKCAAKFRVPKAGKSGKRPAGKPAATPIKETKAQPPTTKKTPAPPNGTAASTRIICPACQAVMRFPGVVPPERSIRCAKCATIFRRDRPQTMLSREVEKPKRPAKPTQLSPAPPPAKPGQPAQGAAPPPPPRQAKVTKLAGTGKEENRPATVLTCAACAAKVKINGKVPPGLAIPCPRCQRRLTSPSTRKTVLAPSAKPATMLVPPAKPTQLAPKGPAKKTQLAPAEAKQPAPTRFRCPGCKAVLSFAGPVPVSKAIKCPKCTRVFRFQPKQKPAVPPKTMTSLPASAAKPKDPAQLKSLPAPKTLTSIAAAAPKTGVAKTRQRPPARRGLASKWLYAAAGVLLFAVALAAFALGKSLWSYDIPASEWVEFAPTDGGCRLLLPGAPEQANSTTAAVTTRKFTVHKEITTRGFTGVPTGAIVKAFMLEVSDWTDPGSFDRVYSSTRDNVLRSAAGRIVAERDITQGPHRGKEFVIEPEEVGAVIGQFYLVGDRSYLLLAVGAHLDASQGDANRFMESFRMVGKK